MKAPATSHRTARTPLSVTATEAKTRFGPLLETALRGETVVITKHDTPKAVLLSIEAFEALGGAQSSDLDTLRQEFDDMLARLQGTARRRALGTAFAATPKELGRWAVAHRRRRG